MHLGARNSKTSDLQLNMTSSPFPAVPLDAAGCIPESPWISIAILSYWNFNMPKSPKESLTVSKPYTTTIQTQACSSTGMIMGNTLRCQIWQAWKFPNQIKVQRFIPEKIIELNKGVSSGHA
jgi:hypothetical protein